MNEQLVRDCLRMFREREDYYKEEWNKEFDKNGSPPDNLWGMMMAYDNAACMLEYALNGNSKALAQFDYYGKDN
jgi:hypothetical protein